MARQGRSLRPGSSHQWRRQCQIQFDVAPGHELYQTELRTFLAVQATRLARTLRATRTRRAGRTLSVRPAQACTILVRIVHNREGTWAS